MLWWRRGDAVDSRGSHERIDACEEAYTPGAVERACFYVTSSKASNARDAISHVETGRYAGHAEWL